MKTVRITLTMKEIERLLEAMSHGSQRMEDRELMEILWAAEEKLKKAAE